MIAKTMGTHKITSLILLGLCYWGSRGYAAEVSVNQKFARDIYKERGALKPKEILEWKVDQKDTSKEWTQLDNLFFKASYPRCFSVVGEGGDPDVGDDPYKTPSVSFRRESKCLNFSKDLSSDAQTLSIGFNGNLSSKPTYDVDGRIFGGDLLFRQKMKINKAQAVFVASITDTCEENKCPSKVQLRYEIYMVCKKRIFNFTYVAPPGLISLERIEKSDYQFPEDFKKIISTFRCK